MERELKVIQVTIANGEAESGPFEMKWAAGGGIVTPNALTATTVIGFKVCDTVDGTFLPLYDTGGTLVEVTIDVAAAKGFAMPDELFAWPYVKLWAEAAGVDVDQEAERTFNIFLKS